MTKQLGAPTFPIIQCPLRFDGNDLLQHEFQREALTNILLNRDEQGVWRCVGKIAAAASSSTSGGEQTPEFSGNAVAGTDRIRAFGKFEIIRVVTYLRNIGGFTRCACGCNP